MLAKTLHAAGGQRRRRYCNGTHSSVFHSEDHAAMVHGLLV